MFELNATTCGMLPPDGQGSPPIGDDTDLCVLREAIVSAFGLPPGQLFTSIKGDPSLRETAPIREKYESRIDQKVGRVLETCEWLLAESGVYALYIGFNSSEVRTESIFNPFNYEIHDTDSLTRDGYVQRHFVPVPFEEKLNTIAWVRSMIQSGPLRNYLPGHWRRLMDEQRGHWNPMKKADIGGIIHGMNRLRGIEGYYLRNAAISLSQCIVRASFNCDGTYIVNTEFFPEFVRSNVP
jgi:hypothetical protein